jgi:hypothetical protein
MVTIVWHSAFMSRQVLLSVKNVLTVSVLEGINMCSSTLQRNSIIRLHIRHHWVKALVECHAMATSSNRPVYCPAVFSVIKVQWWVYMTSTKHAYDRLHVVVKFVSFSRLPMTCTPEDSARTNYICTACKGIYKSAQRINMVAAKSDCVLKRLASVVGMCVCARL